MANPKHLARLKGSVDAWNVWRSMPGSRAEVPDLQGANLVGANLRKALLAGANMRGADLTEADLGGGDLSGADLRKAKLTGVNLADSRLTGANLSEADLSGADLRRADLSGANLILTDMTAASVILADLRSASLSGAVLKESRLNGANLGDAGLFGANLAGADLAECNLGGADLSEADLAGANLVNANLVKADLVGANVGGSVIAGCSFGANDLSRTKGLETMVHRGPSSVATTTLMRTAEGLGDDAARRAHVEAFLRGCGVEDLWIDRFGAMIGRPAEFHPCFITHGEEDAEFARRVRDALQARGIRCWLDVRDRDSGGGAPERGVRLSARVLLCCSAASVGSAWIEKEIDDAFEKERQLLKRRKLQVVALVPVLLDASLSTWANPRAAALRARVGADFTGWERGGGRFDEELERVVRALRPDRGAHSAAAARA
jgi:uncharacterized protein YjbI with pentapeptide repeats